MREEAKIKKLKYNIVGRVCAWVCACDVCEKIQFHSFQFDLGTLRNIFILMWSCEAYEEIEIDISRWTTYRISFTKNHVE